MFGKSSCKQEAWSASPGHSQAEASEVVSGVLERLVREVVCQGGVQEAGKSKVQEPGRGEVQVAKKVGVQEAEKVGVQEANRVSVLEAGRVAVQEAGKSKVQEPGRAEVQAAKRVVVQEASRGKVQEAHKGGVHEDGKNNVHEAGNVGVQEASRDGQKANRSVVQDAGNSAVQDAGISGVEEANKHKGGAVKVQKKSFSPGWFEDASLPPGWRSCVPAPKKVMYYSPCGSLFTNRAQVDKFLGVRKSEALVTKPTSQFVPRKKEKQYGRGRHVKESLLGKKVPTIVMRVEVSKAGNVGENIKDIKKVKTPAKKKLNTGKQLNTCSPEVGCDGNSASSDGAISLSDEDFLSEESSRGKRKMKQCREGPSPKKLCFEKKTIGIEMAAKVVAVQEENKVTEAQEAIHMTEAQEEILLAAFGQWPVAIPELVAVLMEETGLSSGAVRGWFLQTREDCVDLLWATCK